MCTPCDINDPNTLARQGINYQVAEELDMAAFNNLLCSHLTEVDTTMDETNDDEEEPTNPADCDEINAAAKAAILGSLTLFCPAVEEGEKCGGVNGKPCPKKTFATSYFIERQ